jgi:hypothetical protein
VDIEELTAQIQEYQRFQDRSVFAIEGIRNVKEL